MQKFILVPSETVDFEGSTLTQPKHLDALRVSYSAIDLSKDGYFLISIDDTDYNKVIALTDVYDVEGVLPSNIKSKFKLKDNKDVVSALGSLVDPNFNKNNFKVNK